MLHIFWFMKIIFLLPSENSLGFLYSAPEKYFSSLSHLHSIDRAQLSLKRDCDACITILNILEHTKV